MYGCYEAESRANNKREVDELTCFGKKEYLKHLSEDAFVVKYKERSTDRVFEINPKINNSFYDRLCRNAFQTGEYILISGELPEKWK